MRTGIYVLGEALVQDDVSVLRANLAIAIAQRNAAQQQAKHYRAQLELEQSSACQIWLSHPYLPKHNAQILVLLKNQAYITGVFNLKRMTLRFAIAGLTRLEQWDDVIRWRYLPDARTWWLYDEPPTSTES